MTLGIRPHDLVEHAVGTIMGQVALVERLGNETIISLTLPSKVSWLVVLDGDHNLKIGQSVSLGFDPGRAVVFDADGMASHNDGPEV